ncbi:ABC transporter permease [Roseivirga sp. E12]|uniref:ABC transporter permease n=1 Tax=Roseivirga sp. E12 TaxID=2819237 RepID=UPI001ABD1BD9|nr:ABC transporter permease [Roseivirga sp. E12]MBO3699353.1 ABC transporter permease [Roseivirga sp. E12]
MIKSYIKVALRNLKKHKGFSIINILGLSVGLTCCILIGVYINEETSYDQYHENSDEIHRFTREFMSQDGSTSLHLSRLAPPFSHFLREFYKEEIDKIGRFAVFGGTAKYGDKLFQENNFGFADPEIVEILTFETLQGDLVEALKQPGSIIISDEMATKYFGSEDPIGKTINYSSQADLMVRGVYKKMPRNSSFQIDMMADFSLVESFYGGKENMLRAWGSNNFTTLYTLTETGRNEEILRRMEEFLIAHIGENAPGFTRLHTQKLTDIHLKSSLSDEQGQNSDITYIYIFMSIAALILTIACINYMNLATARSANRAKEVGMRKVFGAGKGSLMNQFLVESIVLVFIAVLISIVAALLILPFFRDFTGLELKFNLLANWDILLIIFFAAIGVGILAGSYPAFYLSAFKPLGVLKGRLSSGAKSGVLRKLLVVVQFSISVILIISTVVVFQQLNFIQNKNLGYDKDQMMILNVSSQIGSDYETFKNELLNISGVKSTGGSSRVPSGQLLDSQGAMAEVDGEMTATQIVIKVLSVDPDFIPNYQMEMAGGRNFSKDFATDSASFVLNERSVQVIGWENAQDAVGKNMVYAGVRGKVIGVVKDFHFESLQSEIVPIILVNRPNSMRALSIKIEGSGLRETVEKVEALYAKFSPDTPIAYNFLDDRFANVYQSETQRSQLFTIFSGLAIFLACLGLFGLASFTVAQRGKEISIRKVLGASIQQIVTTLSREFVLLVTLALIISVPVAWYFMNDWLDGYAYRINLSILPFVIAGGIALFIAVMTIGMQTVKAAFANPSDRLRDE